MRNLVILFSIVILSSCAQIKNKHLSKFELTKVGELKVLEARAKDFPQNAVLLMLPSKERSFSEDGQEIELGDSFLPRSLGRFTKEGFIVGVLKTSKAEEINEVIRFYKNESLPVFIIGNDEGNIVLSKWMTLKNKEEVEGVILSTAPAKEIETLKSQLKDYKGRTLLVHHKQDQCLDYPHQKVEELQKALAGVDNIAFKSIVGGKIPEGHPCGSLTMHGYYGIETTTVRNISRWALEGELPKEKKFFLDDILGL